MHYSIIPAEDNFAQTAELICEYGVNLEYNDFLIRPYTTAKKKKIV